MDKMMESDWDAMAQDDGQIDGLLTTRYLVMQQSRVGIDEIDAGDLEDGRSERLFTEAFLYEQTLFRRREHRFGNRY